MLFFSVVLILLFILWRKLRFGVGARFQREGIAARVIVFWWRFHLYSYQRRFSYDQLARTFLFGAKSRRKRGDYVKALWDAIEWKSAVLKFCGGAEQQLLLWQSWGVLYWLRQLFVRESGPFLQVRTAFSANDALTIGLHGIFRVKFGQLIYRGVKLRFKRRLEHGKFNEWSHANGAGKYPQHG